MKNIRLAAGAAVLAAAAAVAAPLAGTASARCLPQATSLCYVVSQVCGVVRDYDPTGEICPYF